MALITIFKKTIKRYVIVIILCPANRPLPTLRTGEQKGWALILICKQLRIKSSGMPVVSWFFAKDYIEDGLS